MKMKTASYVFLVAGLNLLLGFSPGPLVAQCPFPSGGDHGGGDCLPINGQVISGHHYNVRTFAVVAGTRVTIAPINGVGGGELRVDAHSIQIDGTLDASGKGYGAPGGPGGGGGRDQDAGGDPGARGVGGPGCNGAPNGTNGIASTSDTSGGGGRDGGAGTGPYRGGGGSAGTGTGSANRDGTAGQLGGYAAFWINGDVSTDQSLRLGSGGGAGGSGHGGHSDIVNSGGGGGGGGAAGGNGGGRIWLCAVNSIVLRATGQVLARGWLGGDGVKGQDARPYLGPSDNGRAGHGGRGGDACTPGTGLGGQRGENACDQAGAQAGRCSGKGGLGGNGGAGAGGGILFKAPVVQLAGVVDNSGGSSTANGGTVKIFHDCNGLSVSGTITTGRRFTQQMADGMPSFTAQPLDLTVPIGSSTSLCATAISTSPLSYQWFHNGSVITSAVAACLPLMTVQPADAGQYFVIASNACGVAQSRTATLQANQPSNGVITGCVWLDKNANGIKDALIIGNRPDVVFVIDTSGSTVSGVFGGSPVGDPNGDSLSNSILDGEVAGFTALNSYLAAQGFGTNCRVGIVAFSSVATILDLSATQGLQITAYPQADEDPNGVPDVEQALQQLRGGGQTNFKDALAQALNWFGALGTASTNGNLIFLSDGFPTTGGNYANEVAALQRAGFNIRAFGAGTNASLLDLKLIDSRAQVFRTTDELLQLFGGLTPVLDSEPGVADATVYLDLNNNGVQDPGEPRTQTAFDDPGTPAMESGSYRFENLPHHVFHVRQALPPGYEQTWPTGNAAQVVDLRTNSMSTGINFGRREITRLTAAIIQPGLCEITLTTRAGKTYRVEASSDLVHWLSVTNILATGPFSTCRNPVHGSPKCFYRALEQ